MTASGSKPSPEDKASNAAERRTVVAVVVEWRGRIGLFRRSQSVHHDCGRWHCITGYVEPHHSPDQQALEELTEETGLRVIDIQGLYRGDVLHLDDHAGNRWVVHTFRAVTQRRRLRINWEHDSYRWVAPRALTRFNNRVAWLDDVVIATARSADHGHSHPGSFERTPAVSQRVLPAAS